MDKKKQDYLHLYIGCDVLVQGEERTGVLTGVMNGCYECEVQFRLVDNPHHLEEEPEWVNIDDVMVILRPLSDMTEEEAANVYTIERDRILHPPTNYHDIRRGDGCWKIVRLDLIDTTLFITDNAIVYKVTEEGKNPIIEYTRNLPGIILYLLNQHFDLFGLIEAGLAIDKTTTSKPN